MRRSQIGDPQRNKNYRAALFGSKKSDAIEARAAARFAVSERPAHTPPLAPALRSLRQVAGRLQAVVRQRTRLINQFHQLLTLAFPELALIVKDISFGWVLELVQRYPTAALLAVATPADLAAIPYLPCRFLPARVMGMSAACASGRQRLRTRVTSKPPFSDGTMEPGHQESSTRNPRNLDLNTCIRPCIFRYRSRA